jgi:hypothetical protein
MKLRLANRSPYPFSGWLRTVVDEKPPAQHAWAFNSDYVDDVVFGFDQIGESIWPADVKVEILKPGAEIEVTSLEEYEAPYPPIDFDPAIFGGPLMFNGVPMELIHWQQDGAAITSYCRLRYGRTIVVDVWTRWYPGQPWAEAECLLTGSNSAVPDMAENVWSSKLQFGDAITIVTGRGYNPDLLQPVDTSWLFDGQARGFCVTFFWPRLVRGPEDLSSLAALTSQQIGKIGLTGPLYPQGTPRLAPGFDAKRWSESNWQPAYNSLTSWNPAPLGPASQSGVTGSQEDQCLVRSEPLAYVGGEIPVYFSAIGMARRPCQHREQDGTILEPDRHPGITFWGGRADFRTTADKLGKARELTDPFESHLFTGPDVEHPFFFTLAIGHRYTGSPMLQHLLRQQAVVYLLQWTHDQRLTSQPYASRAIGWECANVLMLNRELSDRVLAARVVENWRVRMATITLPFLEQRGDWWDVRVDDPRLGQGAWAITWQQAVGAYWLDVAGEHLNVQRARDVARRGAVAVVRDGWKVVVPNMAQSFGAAAVLHQQHYTGEVDADGIAIKLQAPIGSLRSADPPAGAFWISAPQVPIVDPQGAGTFDGSFNYFGMSLAPATVLRHGPEAPSYAKARELWTWLVANMKTEGQAKWMPPEVE